jgi:hypothetical protein
MDHIGGLRTYLSQGTTIVTHESNKAYYLEILFNADLYSPPAPGAPPPARTAAVRTLYQNILKWKFDVAQHAGAHGRAGSNEDFLKTVKH